MMKDSFTDLPPASPRTEHTRQAEAACASGPENNGSSPESAGWREVEDRIDYHCRDSITFNGLGMASIGLGLLCFATDQTAGAWGGLFFACMSLWLLISGRKSKLLAQTEARSLIDQADPRRDPVSRRDTGECAADGTRYDYVPSAATYSLDNEPMIPVVPWRGK